MPEIDGNICRFGRVQVDVYPSSTLNKVTIHFPDADSYNDPINDGNVLKCLEDIVSNGRDIVCVRHGIKRDLHRLYGKKSDNTLAIERIRLQDGDHHGVRVLGRKYIIRYGVNADLTRVYEFKNDRWVETQHRLDEGEGTNLSSISITLKNFSSFDRYYEIEDLICDRDLSRSFRAGEEIPVYICSNDTHDSGYGRIRYRRAGNSTWVEAGLLVDGDRVNLG